MRYSIWPFVRATIFLAVTPLPIFAWGDSGCASCAFPEAKIASAERLEEQIAEKETAYLRRLLLVGAICSANGLECGNLLEEDAGRLVEFHISKRENVGDIIQKVFLGLIAFGGLFLGVLNRYWPREDKDPVDADS